MKKDPIVITVAITKGGVAKTTTATNLACELGGMKKKVLFVDMDEQGNGTYSLTGHNRSDFNGKGIFDAFRSFGVPGIGTDNFIFPTLCDNVDILPASDMQRQIVGQCEILASSNSDFEPYFYLTLILQGIKTHEYDYIIVDTAPAKAVLLLSGIYAADHVIIPMHPDKYNVDSLQETYKIVNTMNIEHDCGINILGILLTIVERVNFTKLLRQNLAGGDYSTLKFNSEIRKGQAVNDATFGRPVVVDNPRCKPAIDYKDFAKEVLKRIKSFEKRENNG